MTCTYGTVTCDITVSGSMADAKSIAPSFTISTAQKSDAEAIEQLVNSAYRGDSSRKGWTHEADMFDGVRTDLARVQALIASDLSSIFIARDVKTDAIIGTVLFERKDRKGYVGMLSVNPDLQNAGLGKALLLHCEKVARELGFEALEMSVIKQRKELVEFYIRRGFQEVSCVPLPFASRIQGLEFLTLRKDLPVS